MVPFCAPFAFDVRDSVVAVIAPIGRDLGGYDTTNIVDSYELALSIVSTTNLPN